MGAHVDSSDLERKIVLVYSIKQARIKSTKEQPEDKRTIWTIRHKNGLLNIRTYVADIIHCIMNLLRDFFALRRS